MTQRRWILILGILPIMVTLVAAQQRTGSAGDPAQQASDEAGGDIERGRYLVENVAMCIECHSSRDEQGNIVASTRLLGGPLPVQAAWPTKWAVRAPRIAGLPGYTDAMAVRLLTQGAIGRDGTQLRPPMPRFHMTPQDAAAVVAYLRTQ